MLLKKYLSLKIKKNIFKKEWHKIEKTGARPSTYGKLISIDYSEFISKIFEQDDVFVKKVVRSIYDGDLYLLKKAIDKNKVYQIIEGATKFFKNRPPEFHKMIEGVPNFHRWIDEGQAKNYSSRHVKHSLYLFNWNKDISKIRETVMEACIPLKLLAGLSLNQYYKNTPKNNIVERVQIVRYPPGGYIEPHYDNNKIIRLIIAGYLSKKGKSYQKGGFYVTSKNRKLDMENQIDEGDIGFFYASLKHGLETIDPHKKAIKNKKNGRWWFGYNIHNSDLTKKRHVATPVKLKF